jgi:hypothetical protein
MPAKPQWILRVPEILAALEQLTVPVVDRAMVEQLFELRRRQAIELLHRFGGYQAGRTFLIDRYELMDRLRAVQEEDSFIWEVRRRERLESDLQKVRRKREAEQVRIPVTGDVFGATVSDLAEDIRLKPGCLEIHYSDTEDLLAKLFQLAQAAANDYLSFQQASTA